ncbi:hypothetical protein ElyMa_006003800 [Elysia marginata]|uniref:Uncharacterized protein n=1 Tax=Elysia marginata TaxID=1093978 RepID=A0AAV4GFL3_9GAST|nr:hypothetical protein ElyMa_006003800 [Elysia marginata]
MARVISCQTAAILVCILAATAMGSELIGKEKRSELSEGLLAALGGIPKSGPIRTRSVSKETRSVNVANDASNTHSGQRPNCVVRGSSSASGGSSGLTDSHVSWNFGGDGDWSVPDSAVMMSSGMASGYSLWTTACVQMVMLLQFIFVLAKLA